ncbi:HECT-type E3 ubiquitin transferase [Emydomyces testavorans]|uniref:HECT-type E3 ubiquitin transferase n=1 Tax=Emydomyces testavorans TaxID=2070801 RepID=A0AAF0DI11_9EURO|nr:HECT-type E3 ubiquitin transferase [Emydomyces testavorans]
MMATRYHQKPRLYAELLPNISQITVYASLPDCCSGDNPLQGVTELLPSREEISLSYHEQKECLRLPARVSPKALDMFPFNLSRSDEQKICAMKQNEFSFRLHTDETDQAVVPRLCSSIQIPWSAKEMCSGTRVKCRACGNMFLEPHSASQMVWKDLPSAHWAELMDMWHCHKPDPEDGKQHNDDESAAAKGYGVGNHTVCQADTVLLDVMNFYVAEANCVGLEPVASDASEKSSDSEQQRGRHTLRRPICCTKCQRIVGEMQPSTKGLALYKSELSVSRPLQTSSTDGNNIADWETYPVDMIISAQLLEQIDRTGARRYVLHRDDSNTENGGILIWVFNPDIRYSYSGSNLLTSSGEKSNDPRNDDAMKINAQRAMKVFYQCIPNVQTVLNPAKGSPTMTSLEELPLPSQIFEETECLLNSRNALLPESARNFREWRVGLLHVVEKLET